MAVIRDTAVSCVCGQPRRVRTARSYPPAVTDAKLLTTAEVAQHLQLDEQATIQLLRRSRLVGIRRTNDGQLHVPENLLEPLGAAAAGGP